jgi:hypothetical protein
MKEKNEEEEPCQLHHTFLLNELKSCNDAMHAAYCDTDVHIIQFLVSTYRQQTVEIIPKVPFTKTKRVWLTLERVSRFNSFVFRKGKKADSRLAVSKTI